MNAHRTYLSLRPVAAAVACLTLLGAGAAWAGDEDTPLSLTMSHYILRDSNFSRNDERQGETVNSTAARVAFDKSYGRQNYQLAGKLTRSRYAHYGNLLNNDAKDVYGSVSSEFASNWRVALGGSFSESLNPIQSNLITSRVVRNIKKYRDGNVEVRYGNGGRWALIGTYDVNKLRYSYIKYQYQNADQTGKGLKAVYNSTDTLSFGLGQRFVNTHYPTDRGDETVKDRNLDMSVNWQATGLSNLQAQLTRRNSQYTSDSSRSIKGWTGSLDWTYQPAGIFTYAANLSRTTGSDRRVDNYFSLGSGSLTYLGDRSVDDNSVTTSYKLSAQALLTGKSSVSLDYQIIRYVSDYVQAGYAISGGSQVDRRNSIYHDTSLALNYKPLRSLLLTCSYLLYSQTPDATRPRYDGHSFDFSVNFTLD